MYVREQHIPYNPCMHSHTNFFFSFSSHTHFYLKRVLLLMDQDNNQPITPSDLSSDSASINKRLVLEDEVQTETQDDRVIKKPKVSQGNTRKAYLKKKKI